MADISFYAAECMEFPEQFGELRENLTLAEAVKTYGRICRRNQSCVPGIGFVLQDESIPDYSGSKWPLYQGSGIEQELIDLIPEYRNHPLVKQAVENIKPYLKRLKRAGKKKCDLER